MTGIHQQGKIRCFYSAHRTGNSSGRKSDRRFLELEMDGNLVDASILRDLNDGKRQSKRTSIFTRYDNLRGTNQ